MGRDYEMLVYSIRDNGIQGSIVLQTLDGEKKGIIEYRIRDNKFCDIYNVEIDEERKSLLDNLIQASFDDIMDAGLLPIPRCDLAKDWWERTKSKMEKKETLLEVEPNNADGNKKLEGDFYDLFVEQPVREACRVLNKKNIKTIMSSANREDVKNKDVPEKAPGALLYIGQSVHFSIGNGYAWIMIDYDRLSHANKEIMNSLNSGDTVIPLSEEAKKRLEHNCKVNNVPVTQKELVKFYRVMDEDVYYINEESQGRRRFGRIPQPEPPKTYFDENHEILVHKNSLSYNGADYRTVVLRYPIDEKTTTEEVINYFANIVSLLKENNKLRIVSFSQEESKKR